jgi:hypothetical protein
MRARLSETSALDDDMSDKAGWMYADLFLALMVIFLATISFVPEIRASEENANQVRIQSSKIKQSTNFNFDRGLTLLLKTPDGKLVSSKIRSFLAVENLPSDSQVVFMKVIGGFDATPGSDSDATTRAIKYGMQLKKDNPVLFSNSTLSVDISKSVPSDQVALVLTFAGNTQK